ncbi:helix-turn-helix domain-containing protein [Legionella maioricensis]|uniref:AraC family transcriptional regulator n=1 Tax=Legionella maioricensis TaxID=2896528 RepID=A0A9X2D2V8_9GAMM|nr:AraC family transcriptional regulator [Legionella maioricensis]MCL9685660.1 AraC family transcriptional regulator [Legionella maioricensis]MCL9689074.1 AraC family transcriptional regulator [Legionella maioricensis]
MSFPLIDLRSYRTEQCSHNHDYAQLVLPVKGILELEVGNSSGIISSETGAFIPSGEQHSFAGSENNLFVVIDMDEQYSSTMSLPSFLSLSSVTKKFLHFTHYYLINGANDSFSQSLINNLLLNLLCQPVFSNQDSFVLKARSWIDLHFAEPINIVKLAQQCHLSVSQLQRRFKKNTGCRIGEYWRQKRLDHARFLLSTSLLTIESIAFAVGYEHVSAFSRSFNNSFGLYPSQWREMTLAAKKLPPSGN